MSNPCIIMKYPVAGEALYGTTYKRVSWSHLIVGNDR